MSGMKYRLAHNYLIKVIHQCAVELETPAHKANRLLELRIKAWKRNGKSKNLLLNWVEIYKILRLIGVDARKAEVSLILATVFTLKFFWNNLVMFQINFVLFEVMLIGFYCLARKKPHIAGVLFTIITFIKIIPVFLAAYVFLFHFSRKVVISMVTTALICLTLPMAFRGKDLWVQDHVDNYEILIKHYIVEGTIVADRVNHSLKSGMLKTFYPETRHIVDVNPDKYPLILRIAGFMQLMMLGVIITNGIILFRRKVWFSLAYLSSILVFSHLYAMITWTAHLVTLLFCILPVLLIDVRKLPKPGKIAFWIFIGLMVFLGIEGSDTVGEKIYQAIHHYDLHTLMLMGLFIFSSWVVLDKRSAGIFPDGIQI